MAKHPTQVVFDDLLTPFRDGSASCKEGDMFFSFDEEIGGTIHCPGLKPEQFPDGSNGNRAGAENLAQFLELFIELAELVGLTPDSQQTSWGPNVPIAFRRLTSLEFLHRWRQDSEVAGLRRLAKRLPPAKRDQLTCLAVRVALGQAETDRARTEIVEREFDMYLQEEVAVHPSGDH